MYFNFFPSLFDKHFRCWLGYCCRLFFSLTLLRSHPSISYARRKRKPYIVCNVRFRPSFPAECRPHATAFYLLLLFRWRHGDFFTSFWQSKQGNDTFLLFIKINRIFFISHLLAFFFSLESTKAIPQHSHSIRKFVRIIPKISQHWAIMGQWVANYFRFYWSVWLCAASRVEAYKPQPAQPCGHTSELQQAAYLVRHVSIFHIVVVHVKIVIMPSGKLNDKTLGRAWFQKYSYESHCLSLVSIFSYDLDDSIASDFHAYWSILYSVHWTHRTDARPHGETLTTSHTHKTLINTQIVRSVRIFVRFCGKH